MAFMSNLKITKHYWKRHESVHRFGVRPKDYPPTMIDLHPTLACQNKCYFCISENSHVGGLTRANFDRKHTLDWDVLKKVIYELDSMDVQSIQLTGGGEPTLYPNFGDLLEELRPHRSVHRYPSPEIGLITNGILAGEWAKDIIGACSWVRISLDASNPAMYKQIKGVDHFDEVLESLDVLLRHRERKAPRIGVAYIITPESVDGIVEAAEVLSKYEIDYLQFKDVVNRGLVFSQEYREKINALVFQAGQVFKRPVFYSKHEGVGMGQAGFNCNALDYVAVIGADGGVYGCCHLEYLPEGRYGSIYNQSFQNIWSNRKPLLIEDKRCWNCRFAGVNKTIRELDGLEDTAFL